MPHPLFTRFPSRTLIKGGTINYRATDGSSLTGFGGLWGGGGQTYDQTWFTKQMDVMVACGGNAVMIFGDLEQQIAGHLNGSTYLSRWDAVVSAAASRGLYVLVTAASVYQLLGVADVNGAITDTARTLIKNLYNTVRAHTNVIAFVPIHETPAWLPATNPYRNQAAITAGQLATIFQVVHDDVKGESTQIPMTWSGVQAGTTTAAAFGPDSNLTNAFPYCDYLDYHVYYDLSAGHLGAARRLAAGKPIIFGEFGSPQATNPDLGSGCSYTRMKQVLPASGIDGVICWSIFDGVDVLVSPEYCWGIADDDGTLRSKGTTFSSFPTVAEPSVSIFAGTAGSRMRGR